ncbi:MAG: TonB-dependent receptor [Bryobacteraceae bacterium]|nr:TonB-dependent receptor [Bryobacteraceae bacterium]
MNLLKMLLLAVLVIAVSITPAYGQEVRASITGLVTDASGAAVANATVRVVNVASRVAITTTTNETGNYVTPFLSPGAYELTVEAGGFKRFQRQNIVLQLQDRARVDVQLEIGEMTQSVTVSDAVSTLETETASRGATLSNEMLANIPTQGRNPFQIAWAAPGVFKSGGWRYLRSFDIAGTTGFSANGGRSSENEVLLDGISNVRSSRTVIHVPTMDSIQEFKILLNTYDAQYGRTGGGIVTMVTKGGTNQFHGTAFEYFQNDKLNANQFELNAAGKERPPNNINAYGFQVSGPVYLPKLFDGRNRLFWMLAYEGMKQRSADPAVATVPEMAWRSGDFSTLYNASGAQVLIYDPLTTKNDGTRTPFAGNRLPSSRLAKMATEALRYYPAPTSAGVGPARIQNYPFPSRWVGDMDQWIGRMDLNINSKNNVFFRYGQNPFSEYRGLKFIMNPSDVNPAEPTGNAPLIRNGRNWTFDWTSTLTPRMTFDLRAGLNRWEETTGSSYGTGYDQRQMGVDPNLLAQFTRQGFPNINLGTYQSMGTDRLINYAANDSYTVQPNLNMVMGRHVLKMGFEARRYNDNSLNPGLAAGAYTFGKNWTQAISNRADAVSGNELATFLLGYPTSAYVDRNIDPAYVHYFYAGFFQDDWKITSRLTVNLGLRWDYESPAVERYDRQVRGLDFNAPSPIAPQVKGLDLKGAVLFSNLNGQPRGVVMPDKNNWAPRVGAAYRIRDKWVIRGGYGLYYLGQSAAGPNNGYSQRTNAVVSVDNNLTPAVTTANAFALQPGGQLLAAVGNSEGAASFLGQALTANYQNRPLPYSHQYSFDIQRELPAGILVEAGYVGNLTRKLPMTASANFVPISELGRRTPAGVIDTAYYTQRVPNPMAGLIPNNAALNGATIPRVNLMYAFPQFSGLSFAHNAIGRQHYDSFQLKFSKRFAQGITFLGSYTIAKTLEQVSLQNAQFYNLAYPASSQLIKQPADQIDIPQKFNITAVIELPFGKGRAFANQIPKGVDWLIGGWGLDLNVTYMSGWAVAYPNAAQVTPGSAKLENPSIPQWFNTSLWNDSTGKRVAAQEPYTLRTFPLRFSDVRLPGYQNWDVSMSKTFPIYERMKLQFRFEAVNAMNHPWFTGIASVDVTNAQFGRLNPVQNNLPRFLKLALVLRW